MEIITGNVEKITYANKENGFCVLTISQGNEQEQIKAVGYMPQARLGSVLELRGSWKFDSRYGKQFMVSSCTEKIPATAAGIERYLGSGMIKGIGPKYAAKIVAHFKESTIRIIEEEPKSLGQIEGIGEKRISQITEAWQEHKEIKNLMLFLQEFDISTTYGIKIYRRYGNDSIETVRENPYKLADDIWGIGFKTADSIAEKLGHDKDSYARIRSGILYTLFQASGEGHCFLTEEELIQKSTVLLDISINEIKKTINDMKLDESIIAEDGCYYSPTIYFCEKGTALRIKEILNCSYGTSDLYIEEIIDSIQKNTGLEYDDIQVKAIHKAVSSKFMILTGGPGTGKTTTMLAVIKAFSHMGRRIFLAAPTGRAAKRLAEVSGSEAKTIHRLLEYKPTEGYQKNSDNKLDCDVLILDEASMIDIVLMYNLLRAVKNSTVIILVGDVDQLPSVGPGNVFRDIIESGTADIVRLTRVFRQALNSLIVSNAHRINQGKSIQYCQGRDGDFYFIEENDISKVAETIKDLCKKRLPEYYGLNGIEDIQVISPMTRGEVGTRKLNEELQKVLNPESFGLAHSGVIYRVEDKVMQTRNNYDKGVFNGDIGKIIAIDQEEKKITVSFDNNKVEYEAAEFDEILHAYAITVHKSQGSEYNAVISPLVTQHFMMLQRNLLYTCVTRAKRLMILVGSKKALYMSLKNNRVEKRNTALAARLCELASEEVGHEKNQ